MDAVGLSGYFCSLVSAAVTTMVADVDVVSATSLAEIMVADAMTTVAAILVNG